MDPNQINPDVAQNGENSQPDVLPTNPLPTAPIPQPQPLIKEHHDTETKTIITVLVLLFAYPAGIILMWAWASWPKWVKFLITLPIILSVVLIILAFALASKDPLNNLGKAQDATYDLTAQEFASDMQKYYNIHQNLPWEQTPPCSAKPSGVSIMSLTPCVRLLINDGILKEFFLNNTSLNYIYASDNSTTDRVKLSVCYLPKVNNVEARYLIDGQACSGTSCYICSFSEFPPTASKSSTFNNTIINNPLQASTPAGLTR